MKRPLWIVTGTFGPMDDVKQCTVCGRLFARLRFDREGKKIMGDRFLKVSPAGAPEPMFYCDACWPTDGKAFMDMASMGAITSDEADAATRWVGSEAKRLGIWPDKGGRWRT